MSQRGTAITVTGAPRPGVRKQRHRSSRRKRMKKKKKQRIQAYAASDINPVLIKQERARERAKRRKRKNKQRSNSRISTASTTSTATNSTMRDNSNMLMVPATALIETTESIRSVESSTLPTALLDEFFDLENLSFGKDASEDLSVLAAAQAHGVDVAPILAKHGYTQEDLDQLDANAQSKDPLMDTAPVKPNTFALPEEELYANLRNSSNAQVVKITPVFAQDGAIVVDEHSKFAWTVTLGKNHTVRDLALTVSRRFHFARVALCVMHSGLILDNDHEVWSILGADSDPIILVPTRTVNAPPKGCCTIL